MNLYINQAESRIKSAITTYEATHRAMGIYIALSKMDVKSIKLETCTIIVNIIRDHFRSASGDIYLFKNRDIVIVYRGKNQNLITEGLYKLHYLFSEDSKEFSSFESFSNKFSQIFDEKNWKDFISLCNKLYQINIEDRQLAKTEDSLIQIISGILEEYLQHINWNAFVKLYPIFKYSYNDSSKAFIEICIDINSLAERLGKNFDILNNTSLKSYLKEFIDFKILMKLIDLVNLDNKEVYLINLNINTLESEEFWIWANSLDKDVSSRIIIALSISEVFADLTNFLKLREKIIDYNFKLCLDCSDYLSFMQVDRQSLGFDLIRIKHQKILNLAELNELTASLKSKIALSGTTRTIIEIEDLNEMTSYLEPEVMLYQLKE